MYRIVLPDICSFPCTVIPYIERYCNFCNKSFFFLGHFFVFRCFWGGFFILYSSFVFLDVFNMLFLFVKIYSQKRTERRALSMSWKIVLICFNIIISRHLNKRRVIILCCFLKYHFNHWCCDCCHSCWCWACFCWWGSCGRLYRVRLWALSGLVWVLQKFETLKNEGLTCKIADISSYTSQVWRWTNPVLFLFFRHPAVILPSSLTASAYYLMTPYRHRPSFQANHAITANK